MANERGQGVKKQKKKKKLAAQEYLQIESVQIRTRSEAPPRLPASFSGRIRLSIYPSIYTYSLLNPYPHPRNGLHEKDHAATRCGAKIVEGMGCGQG